MFAAFVLLVKSVFILEVEERRKIPFFVLLEYIIMFYCFRQLSALGI